MVETPTHEDNLIAQPYMEDSLAVIAPAKSPFYSGQVLSKNEFIKQHFLLREPESGVREVFDRVMRKEDINITPIWEGMSTMALVNAVINGIGISVVPKRMIYGPLKRGLIHVISVENIDFNRYFYIVHHKDKLLTAMLKDFVNLCKTYQMPSQIHDNADLLCHE